VTLTTQQSVTGYFILEQQHGKGTATDRWIFGSGSSNKQLDDPLPTSNRSLDATDRWILAVDGTHCLNYQACVIIKIYFPSIQSTANSFDLKIIILEFMGRNDTAQLSFNHLRLTKNRRRVQVRRIPRSIELD